MAHEIVGTMVMKLKPIPISIFFQYFSRYRKETFTKREWGMTCSSNKMQNIQEKGTILRNQKQNVMPQPNIAEMGK